MMLQVYLELSEKGDRLVGASLRLAWGKCPRSVHGWRKYFQVRRALRDHEKRIVK
jgi:hypothetical protein